MTEGPLLRKIVLYTIPLILTGILQLLFNAADLVVVGRFCGSISVGAVGATGAVINLIVTLFMGLSVGAGILVAHGFGAGDDGLIHRTVHTAIPTAVIGGIILSLIGFFGSEYFLALMDTPADVIGLSTLYMKIYFCGVTASLVYNFGAAILRAAGNSKSPLIFLTISGVVNVILNVIFVRVFDMNVGGVALATSISQLLAATLVLIELAKRTDACRLIWNKLKIYKKEFMRMLAIGVPAGIQGSLFAISNVLIQSSINSFDTIAISGNAAAANIEGFAWVAINSVEQSAMNFTGQNYGAGKFDRITKILKICLALSASIATVLGLTIFALAGPLLSIYITDSALAIEIGIMRIALTCVPYFTCGVMSVMTGMIRGMGSSLAPMIMSVLGVCALRVVWIYTIFAMPQYHTLECIYISYPISWSLTFAMQFAAFLVLKRRKERLKAQHEEVQITA